MFNPIVMTRLADLLQQGAILKQKFQPYEAHLQYLAQFMIDYNLYGCDYLNSTHTTFRAPIPEHHAVSDSDHLWHDRSVRTECITNDAALPRVSHCSIEVDIGVQSIANRGLVQERRIHHDFIEKENSLSADAKLVHSMAGLWRDETARRKRRMTHPKSGSSPFPPEVMVPMSAEPRIVRPQWWIHEEELRQQVGEIVDSERERVGDARPTFDGFVGQNKYEPTINTILESVEDLHPRNLLPALGLSGDLNETKLDPASSIEVDEQKARATDEQEDCFFPEDSDEEMLQLLGEAQEKIYKDVEGGAMELSVSSTNDKCLNIPGICTSGFKTGKVPFMSVSTTLLNAAENAGHVGRSSKHVLRRAQKGNLKQSGSGLSFEEQPKRNKQEFDSSVSKEAGGQQISPPLSQRSTPLKRASQKKRVTSVPEDGHILGQTLNFAVVKNQNDPFTRLRLSQKSKLSSSQQSDEGTLERPADSGTGSRFTSPAVHESEKCLTLYSQYAREPLDSTTLTQKFQRAISDAAYRPCILFAGLPPPRADAVSLRPYNLPDVIYQDAFYSDEKDVPLRSREYAGREYRLQSNTLPFLPNFDFSGNPPGSNDSDRPIQTKASVEALFDKQRRQCSLRLWEIAQPPPTNREVIAWEELKAKEVAQAKEGSQRPRKVVSKFMSQIDGPTPRNKHGFKYTQRRKTTSVQHEVQYMSTMSLEVHINTRGKLVPNPEEDEIQCVFWCCKGDDVANLSQNDREDMISGIIVSTAQVNVAQKMRRVTESDVIEEESELDVLVRLVEVVKTLDPDILTGYEVHGGSWGFLMERARLKYDYNLCDELSRMKSQSHGRFGKENDRWGFNTTSTIRVTGRHMINIWRAMRGELNLLQYTMENVAWHLLHRRVPHFSHKTLTSWYRSGKPHDLSRLLRYFQSRTRVDLQILEANELIPRTSEQARLLGVDFFSVFSRGSQFKVESIMFRIAKPENFVLISPSKKQVGGQNALECLPLVMEPQSAFYSSPLLVLDFQSLYPSVMIAYNYCYSTFLGRINNWRGANKMGITEYNRQAGLMALVKDYINIAPNGMMYVNGQIRKSLLAKMLTEILETRIMVKSGMKEDKDDKTLQQLLNNRQLALKLLANVTYGYTSASFSGRMPCSEIADSIVQTARETLERSIAYIHSVERWGAEVVYGDTDSLFIYLKGRTKDQAFDIGNEISETITKMNPRPVKLKFEKVYHPCVLLAKKRYVGYMYETKDQAKPEFDAKGIETVRRDGTPAEQKIEEKALRLLFETADLSRIKSYFQKQCSKIMRGAVSVQDFCFAREVRLGSYSDKGPPPAGALISARKMLADARAEPQYGERVPYVVITGAPGARLIDRCVAPEDLLSNPHWQLDADYYINKNLIPPLERIFNLVGANVRGWYDEMPKVQRIYQSTTGGKRATLESYMRSSHCLVCGGKFLNEAGHTHHQQAQSSVFSSLCPNCRSSKHASLLALQTKLTAEERRYQDTLTVCRSCTGDAPIDDVRCDSKDCPVFWTRMRQRNKVVGERSATEPVIRGLVESGALDW